MKLTIFIACFNEKMTILDAVKQAQDINIDKEIIVIDNCSTDGTKEILEGLKNEKGIRIIFHSRNMGVGYSFCEAVRLSSGDYFYGPGADLEYKMNDVYGMMKRIEAHNLDAVFGSRLLERKRVSVYRLVKERPFWLGTIIATRLVNFLFRRHFTDIIATKLIKTQVLKRFDFQATNQAFEFELVSRLCKNKYKIEEVPVWYRPRSKKEGKTIRAIDMIPAVLAILRVRLKG